MKAKKTRVAFCGGGTGGHIFPGLSVAAALREAAPEVEIYWLGSSRAMDREIVKGDKTIKKFYGIPAGKLRRYFSLSNFFDAFKIVAGVISSLLILAKLRPALLFSKGGFVSVPPVVAARLLGIKVFTHECDFTPGLATKINAHFAKKILTTYEETARYFPKKMQQKIVVTGNPIRGDFYEKKPSHKAHEKPVLLVLGGSLGARQINELIWGDIKWLTERFYIVHQTGKGGIDHALTYAQDGYAPSAFIKDVAGALGGADVVVSRSGASSIWEAATVGVPELLIPLCGSGTRGDQVDNAKWFCDKGAALMLVGEDATGEKMRGALASLLDADTRKKMIAAQHGLTLNRADKGIAALIKKEIDSLC